MLKELENTVVLIKSRSEFNQLMKIFGKQGWRWCTGDVADKHKTINPNPFEFDEFWVVVSDNFYWRKVDDVGGSKLFGLPKVISLSEFKKIQGLEPRPFQVGDRIYDKRYNCKGTIARLKGWENSLSDCLIKRDDGVEGQPGTGKWGTRLINLELLSPCEEKEEQKLDFSWYSSQVNKIMEEYPIRIVNPDDLYFQPMRPFVTTSEDDLYYKESTVKSMKKGIMSYLRDIPNKLKRVLNPGLQARYQLGHIDGNMELTSDGKQALLNFLEEKHEKELGENAIAEVKRLKKQKKSECED